MKIEETGDYRTAAGKKATVVRLDLPRLMALGYLDGRPTAWSMLSGRYIAWLDAEDDAIVGHWLDG